MVTIPFLVLAGPSDPITPLDDLKAALRVGALQRFQSCWGRAPGGDCHVVAGALMDGIPPACVDGCGAALAAPMSVITPGWSVAAGP